MGFFDRARGNNHQSNVTYDVKKLSKPVYYVESPDDDTVLVGMDVTIVRYRKEEELFYIVNWWDSTPHERRIGASQIKIEGEFFAFKRIDEEGGQTYYFRPMTLEIYNAKVKDRLIGKKDFENETDMINAFLVALRDGDV